MERLACLVSRGGRSSSRPSRQPLVILAIAVFATFVLPGAGGAQRDGDWSVGFRANLMGGSGKPTNDVLGYGLFGRHRLGRAWAIGFGIDRSDEFDIERAAELVGLVQDPTVPDIDNAGESTTLKVWAEREYRSDRLLRWYWGAGVGFADLSVENASGPTADGGPFDVSIDAGDELLLEGMVGLRMVPGGRWFVEVTFRLEQHLADWELVDLDSGSTGSIDDYTLRGVHLAVGWSF